MTINKTRLPSFRRWLHFWTLSSQFLLCPGPKRQPDLLCYRTATQLSSSHVHRRGVARCEAGMQPVGKACLAKNQQKPRASHQIAVYSRRSLSCPNPGRVISHLSWQLQAKFAAVRTPPHWRPRLASGGLVGPLSCSCLSQLTARAHSLASATDQCMHT